MSSGILLLEFALLGFIAAVYALARRNLSAAAAREQAGTAQSLREVQETVTGLISVLQSEAASIEKRLDERVKRIELLSAEIGRAESEMREVSVSQYDERADAAKPPPSTVEPEREASAVERALHLLAAGETALSAARQTALTVTEVEMAARMRGARSREH